MRNRIWTIARRELASYFDHATAYILLVIFLGFNFFFFFRDAYLVGNGSLRPMFGLLPWLLLFFVPAVSMRAIAEERDAGTLEVVLAQPLSVLEFVLGKALGVFLFLMVALLGTIGVPIALTMGAELQWGVIFAQYLGATFLIGALVAIGLWASSLTRNQVTAFILGVTITFGLYLIGLEVVVLGLPRMLSVIATRLGILGHFENVARGVIDFRDVLYFVAVTAAFLALSYAALMRQILSRRRPAYRRLLAGTAGFVAFAVLASLVGAQLRGRIDLTPGKLYTLSDPTVDLLRDLDDIVTIKFFRSEEIPPQFASLKRDVDDLVRDFDAAGGGNLNLMRLSPDDDEEAEQEARTLGIQAVEFNVFGEEELQVRSGYLGLAIQYAGQVETIPFVQESANLEYRLASAIRSLTVSRRPVIAFLGGHGELDLNGQLRAVASQLQEQYQVQTLRLDTATVQIPDSVDVLVIAGPRTPFSERDGAMVREYLGDGGSALVMMTGADIDPQSLVAQPAFHPVLDSLLNERGAAVVRGIAYDLRAHQNVQIQGTGGTLLRRQYPLWPYGQPASNHVIVRDMSPLALQWSSPMELTTTDTASVIPLLATTPYGGFLTPPASMDANQDWSRIAVEDLAPQVMAVALLGGGSETSQPDDETDDQDTSGRPLGESSAQGRIVLIGNATLITDEALEGLGPAGWAFFQNAVDWLAQDEALIRIRTKDRAPPQLVFASALARDAAKHGNTVGVPLLFVLFGILRLARRRRLQADAYRPNHGDAAA
jgi:ABC-2 type transport system permease protein